MHITTIGRDEASCGVGVERSGAPGIAHYQTGRCQLLSGDSGSLKESRGIEVFERIRLP